MLSDALCRRLEATGGQRTSSWGNAYHWRNSAGQLHRIGGPAWIEESGWCEWWTHGVLHRLDGPAVVHTANNHLRQWWVNDQLHRIDGPAIIQRGLKAQWHVRGCNITTAVNQWIEQNELDPNWRRWDGVTWCLFRLRFA